jgi:tetratricopeptide (TPR) repeat protein
MKRFFTAGFFLLILNSAYLGISASATVFYMANVLFHAVFGLILVIPFLRYGRRLLRTPAGQRSPWSLALGWLGYGLMVIAMAAGLALVILGNLRTHRWILVTHVVCAVPAVCLILFYLGGMKERRDWLTSRLLIWGSVVGVLGILGPAWFLSRAVDTTHADQVIRNPPSPPASMDEESMHGAEGPFYPSSVETHTGGLLPSSFFLDSASCGQSGCHPDIYEQWHASAHHFASFNNQWYRKSIEYMQDVVGVQPSKWCAGCHDQALLFSGMFDQPVADILDTPEAHAGIGCTGCHAISRVKGSMGNGGYVIAYPPLHHLAASENPVLKALHNFLVRIDPEPHRQIFMKSFHRDQTPEFCSSCHKVHLDQPVNHYRWQRGFNEYDNWQSSGVSGQGARSFYYPDQAQKCAACHMPLVPSTDAGNIDGMVHDHRFPGANTALPVANRDPNQLALVTAFLQDQQVRVDIFALSEPGIQPAATTETGASRPDPLSLSSTFAVGEEQGMAVGVGSRAGPALPIIGPLDRVTVLRRGDSTRLDVVVRTLKVGHFFPGGTVDAFDVWLELKAVDNRGQTVFWSGAVADEGKGPVEEGAHFYRSLMLDEHGNPINKRNAWATRAVMYVNLIPPGAADVAHYRLRIPEDGGDEIEVTAKLNYRKFSWWYTHFSFAGQRDPRDPDPNLGPGFDDGRWVFTGDVNNVSGPTQAIPEVPIVTMAQDRLRIRILPAGTPLPEFQPATGPLTRERWNDYGIGLLRQGDLKGAERAFLEVTRLEPDYVDGWVNVARAHLREGDIDGAETFLREALARDPDLPKSHYFYALALKQRGRYDEALKHLYRAQETYPNDRVLGNEIGRVYFLKRDFTRAVAALQAVLTIDPEDLQAHYHLMLSYRGLGDMVNARKEQQFYLRFKADESSQRITGAYRRDHPEANNERQPIHEHHSVPLPWLSQALPSVTLTPAVHP